MILFIVNAKKRSFLELLLSRVNLWVKFRSELKKMGANFAGRICISFDPLNCPQASNLELFFLFCVNQQIFLACTYTELPN